MPTSTMVPNSVLGDGLLSVAPRRVKCELCNVTCPKEEHYQQHVLGMKHKRALDMKSNTPTTTVVSANVQNGPFTCKLCDVKCHQKTEYQKHLKNKRHTKAQRKTPTNSGSVAIGASNTFSKHMDAQEQEQGGIDLSALTFLIPYSGGQC